MPGRSRPSRRGPCIQGRKEQQGAEKKDEPRAFQAALHRVQSEHVRQGDVSLFCHSPSRPKRTDTGPVPYAACKSTHYEQDGICVAEAAHDAE